MEQIQKGITGRHQLGQQQLNRVRWPLTSRPKGQLAQPLREGFSVALGGIFDLLQLFGTKPGGNGFGTQTRSRCIGWRRMAECGDRS